LAGWIFTVVGVVVSLIIVKEYWWLSALILGTIFLSLLLYAYRCHTDLEKARGSHAEELRGVEERRQAELQPLRDELRTATERLRETEGRLSQVGFETVARIEQLLASHSASELSRELTEYARFVGRMCDFKRHSTKPIDLRTIAAQAGGLYVVAKAEGEALCHVAVGDEFRLVKQGQAGVQTPCADLVVHQPPNAAKNVLYFRIKRYLSDEMGHLEQLARSGDVQGIKGYGIELACDVTPYGADDIPNLIRLIQQLVEDIASRRGD
jgi:hypothetical protein